MATSYNFDLQTAQRIVRTVRDAERTAGAGAPPASGSSPSTGGTFYAKLVGESAATPGNYSWQLVDRVDGAWVVRSPRVFDSACSAVEANAAQKLKAGTVVQMRSVGNTTAAYPTDPSPAPTAAATGDVDLKVSATPYPAFLFTVGLGLPPPGSPRMVLQLDDNNNAVWDWVEAIP